LSRQGLPWSTVLLLEEVGLHLLLYEIYYLWFLEWYVGLDLLESSLLLEMQRDIKELSKAATFLLT
jgi:hypothetical protein